MDRSNLSANACVLTNQRNIVKTCCPASERIREYSALCLASVRTNRLTKKLLQCSIFA